MIFAKKLQNIYKLTLLWEKSIYILPLEDDGYWYKKNGLIEQ